MLQATAAPPRVSLDGCLAAPAPAATPEVDAAVPAPPQSEGPAETRGYGDVELDLEELHRLRQRWRSAIDEHSRARRRLDELAALTEVVMGEHGLEGSSPRRLRSSGVLSMLGRPAPRTGARSGSEPRPRWQHTGPAKKGAMWEVSKSLMAATSYLHLGP